MPPAPQDPFVPDWFDVPLRLEGDGFVLVPLGAEHNVADYAAWTSSMDHIHATPGFEDRRWPHPMSLEENLGDLVRHADDFAARHGFTYTVLEPDGGSVIGCVYIYPVDPADVATAGFDARVRSWVTASWADLDVLVWRAVSAWLDGTWPFLRVSYGSRT